MSTAQGQYSRQSLQRFLAYMALLLPILACSATDIVGDRSGLPTPTSPPFATATPGGRYSFPLNEAQTGTPSAQRPTAPGEIVAPAATATVLAATVIAGTATAGAPRTAPQFLPGDCPPLGNPPPPDPTLFSRYAEAISLYLSAGGATTVLEATLRNWGAIREGAVVQANTDLTGDNAPEVVVSVYDPERFNPGLPSPGVLMIFGCAQKAYRLLYSTTFAPDLILPDLLRVGDMNGDTRGELVYNQRQCSAGRCISRAQILSWNAVLGQFSPLNDLPIDNTDGKIGIGDPDGDGILEVSVLRDAQSAFSAEPIRRATYYWDWDGANYREALVILAPAVYRIHALHDADRLFDQGDWRGAIRAYDRVRDNPAYAAWSIPNEIINLRAYAGLKKMLAQAANNARNGANATLQALLAENPPGVPSEAYAAVARAFMDRYNRRRDLAQACQNARTVVQSRPETLIALNSYGLSNRIYGIKDLCPFE